MRKITKTIGAIAMLLLICATANAISSVNQGFMAGWFAGDGGNITGLNADHLTTGTLSDARLSENVFYHGRNITLTNDTFSVLNSYWDYFTPTEIRLSKNVSFPNDDKANSLIYVHSVLSNSNGGINNIVSVAENNNISGNVGSIAIIGHGISNDNGGGAWGGWFIGSQIPNHTGGAKGVEIDEASNSNKTLPSGIDPSAAIGLQLVSIGTYSSSSGIHITSENNSGFKDGIDIEKANTGINFTVPDTITSNTAIDAKALRINSSRIVLSPGGAFPYPSLDLYPSTGGWWRISEQASGVLGFWYNGTDLKFSVDANTGGIRIAGGGNAATGYLCQYANRTVYTKDGAC